MPEQATAPAPVAERLARLIASHGPISVAYYMAEANAHYYASRDPLGVGGDFITAPEISQMFGELVGLWLADLWVRAGRPPNARYVELGPGRGTLAADALRAMRSVGFQPQAHLVDTSPALRHAQAERVADAGWHDHVDTLPEDGPLLVVANEFFDALPVRQLVATAGGWRERRVDWRDGRFVPVAGPLVGDAAMPDSLRTAAPGTIVETSPASAAIIDGLAARLVRQGGAALIIDYGHARTAAGETLQAVRAHSYSDPWSDPGESDLTAHVDFEALGAAARRDGIAVRGPVAQGAWLKAMGIEARAAALTARAPGRAQEIASALHRLTDEEQMGSLFKAMAVTAASWPRPEALS